MLIRSIEKVTGSLKFSVSHSHNFNPINGLSQWSQSVTQRTKYQVPSPTHTIKSNGGLTQTSLFVSGQFLHKCNKCLTPPPHSDRSQNKGTRGEGVPHPPEYAMLFKAVRRGALTCICISGEQSLGQAAGLAGLWRYCQPFIKLDQQGLLLSIAPVH